MYSFVARVGYAKSRSILRLVFHLSYKIISKRKEWRAKN